MEDIVEERKNNEEVINRRNEKVIKIWSIVIAILLVLVVFIIKASFPKFPTWVFVIIITVILLISLLIYFLSNITKWWKNRIKEGIISKEKLPRAVELGTLIDIASSAMKNKLSGNMLSPPLNYWYETVGKNIKNKVFVYQAKAVYSENMKRGIVYVLLNVHDPINLRAILIDPNHAELSRKIHSLSITDIEEEPEERVIERFDSTTGRTERVTEKLKQKEEEVKEKKTETKEGEVE
jgi:hypothetical protein